MKKKLFVFTVLIAVISLTFVIAACNGDDDKDNDDGGITFIAVTDITGIAASYNISALPVTLTGTVAPDTATNKTIVWSLVSATAPGAAVSAAGVLSGATGNGNVIVKATIINGKSATENFEKNFTINITGGGSSGPSWYLSTSPTPGTPVDNISFGSEASVVTNAYVYFPANAEGITSLKFTWTLTGSTSGPSMVRTTGGYDASGLKTFNPFQTLTSGEEFTPNATFDGSTLFCIRLDLSRQGGGGPPGTDFTRTLTLTNVEINGQSGPPPVDPLDSIGIPLGKPVQEGENVVFYAGDVPKESFFNADHLVITISIDMPGQIILNWGGQNKEVLDGDEDPDNHGWNPTGFIEKDGDGILYISSNMWSNPPVASNNVGGKVVREGTRTEVWFDLDILLNKEIFKTILYYVRFSIPIWGFESNPYIISGWLIMPE